MKVTRFAIIIITTITWATTATGDGNVRIRLSRPFGSDRIPRCLTQCRVRLHRSQWPAVMRADISARRRLVEHLVSAHPGGQVGFQYSHNAPYPASAQVTELYLVANGPGADIGVVGGLCHRHPGRKRRYHRQVLRSTSGCPLPLGHRAVSGRGNAPGMTVIMQTSFLWHLPGSGTTCQEGRECCLVGCHDHEELTANRKSWDWSARSQRHASGVKPTLVSRPTPLRRGGGQWP